MNDTCKHERIQTYRFEDGAPAQFWACADCKRRFEPLPVQVDRPTPKQGEDNGGGLAACVTCGAPAFVVDVGSGLWDDSAAPKDHP